MSVARKLLPGDRDRLAGHLLRLDPQSRQDRFAGTVSDRSIEDYVRGLGLADDLLLGWFEAGALRATGHLALAPGPWPREAELALTVEKPWQDRGIGTALCCDLLVAARNRLVSRVWLVCLMDNIRIQRIVRKLEGTLLHQPGTVEGEIRLPPPDGLSLWQEAYGDGGALLQTLIEQWGPGPAEPDEPAPGLTAGGRLPAT